MTLDESLIAALTEQARIRVRHSEGSDAPPRADRPDYDKRRALRHAARLVEHRLVARLGYNDELVYLAIARARAMEIEWRTFAAERDAQSTAV